MIVLDGFVIIGGKPIQGKVRISGAKNAALKIISASILTADPTRIYNVPDIEDVRTMLELLKSLGAEVRSGSEPIEISCPDAMNQEAPYEMVRKMRASIIVMGPLLTRFGRARVALPGGCNIGFRKIDQHLKGLEALGAEIYADHGFVEARAQKLSGTLIPLDFPSVGATENILMAAVLAKGTTIIENAAREPEIVDLADFLTKMGAKISGAGSSTITIEGVEGLRGTEHSVIPDRIEAGTWLIVGAMPGGKITLENVDSSHLDLVISKLEEIGFEIEKRGDNLISSAPNGLRSADVSTLPYPGFPSDLQPLLASLLSVADGTSIITENIFENRFIYVDELIRMGADIRVEGHHAVIRGMKKLWGVPVNAPDLRAGAALMIAALSADGATHIHNVHHIDRGYEEIDIKLRSVGAQIERFTFDD